jgi:serine/threonine-protein kinase HipA
MQKRENLRTRQQRRRARSLMEWDFLLGVHDETRLGALRFRNPHSGRFIDSDEQFAAPPITSLRDLPAASLEFESHTDDEEHPDYQRWLAQLFAPGTSLGGHVQKHPLEGRRCSLSGEIPSRQDRRDIAAGTGSPSPCRQGRNQCTTHAGIARTG